MSDISEIPDGNHRLTNQAQQSQQKARDPAAASEKPGEKAQVFRVPQDRYEETRLEFKADEMTGEKKLKASMATEVPAEPDQYQPHEMSYKRDIKEENTSVRGDGSITDDARRFSEEAAKGSDKHDRQVGEKEVLESGAHLKKEIAEDKGWKIKTESALRRSNEAELDPNVRLPSVDSPHSDEAKETALQQSREQLLANAKVRYLSIEQGIRQSVEGKNKDLTEGFISQQRRGKTIAEAAEAMLQSVLARADQKLTELELSHSRKNYQENQVEQKEDFHEELKTKERESTLRDRKSQTVVFSTVLPPKIHSSNEEQAENGETANKETQNEFPPSTKSESKTTSQPEFGGPKKDDIPQPKPIMPHPWNASVPDLLKALANVQPVETKHDVEMNVAEEIVKELKNEGVFGIAGNGRNHSVSEFFKLKQFEYDLEEKPTTTDSLLMETENAIFKTLSTGKNDGVTQSLLRAAEAINAYRNELARRIELPHAERPPIRVAAQEHFVPKDQSTIRSQHSAPAKFDSAEGHAPIH